ncbi:isoprenylcysteine carboxylmethyltransferase family protein [Halomonas sp. MCCC 1A11058]|uniref:methanethiol S-methyltransferase n=2 Tax=Billgrantia aerodenitrificans TaxID=2733483 RepID=A0ABS9AM88_9GAMM|nr:isoprenylcysteine carboxylmethyltransferase family protein [Halomonas aerodenitrificans]
MTMRWVTMLYAVVAYLVFWLCSAYLIGFTADILVPRTVNHGPVSETGQALLINASLMLMFGVQHSIMARQGFKRWCRAWIPEPMERSTYVLSSSLMLGLLYWGWRPLPYTLWWVEGGLAVALWCLFVLGWALVVHATFLISHGELLGVSQAYRRLRGRALHEIGFRTPGLHRLVRHPLMSGLLLAFWSTPHMTVGHFCFAAGMSLYILIGIHFEERSLVRAFGDRYRVYQATTPMLVPSLRPLYREVASRFMKRKRSV